MSAPGPSSIPTSHLRRPTKRPRLNPSTSTSAQAASVDALFAHPDREIKLPSTAPKRGPAPPPEIVTNVQGSSAGAGSGEFHVYKASRRREYERLRVMDEETREEREREEFESRRAQKEREDEERTRKRREKRGKMKARKERGRKEGGKQEGTEDGGGVIAGGENGGEDEKKGAMGPPPAVKVADGPGLVIHDDD